MVEKSNRSLEVGSELNSVKRLLEFESGSINTHSSPKTKSINYNFFTKSSVFSNVSHFVEYI